LTNCLSALNNTYIYDGTVTPEQNGCNPNNSRIECFDQFGGLFNEGNSTTWSSAANLSVLKTSIENQNINPNHASDLWGTDIVELNSTISIPQFPLGISRDGGEAMNMLGLGRNSTLLNLLAENGTIPSRTWSFWQGWTGATTQDQMDGILVLGGYDAAKISGDKITIPIDNNSTNPPDHGISPCNVVTVTDIRMNLKNGFSPSLFGSSHANAFRGCAEPHFEALSLTLDMWTRFLQISGSTYVGRSVNVISFYTMLVEAQGACVVPLCFDPNIR